MAAEEKAIHIPEQAKTPPYAWVILAVMFLASCSVPINMFKMPPCPR